MKYLILTIITVFLFSCHTHKPTGDNTSSSIKEVVLNKEYTKPKGNADFTVLEASIEGDVLTVQVSYSGGCEAHEFNAYFNGMYMKSLPPKASIFIEHNNNDDSCRKVVTEELKFNLKNMRSPDKEGDYTIMIGMNNYEGYLEYKY